MKNFIVFFLLYMALHSVYAQNRKYSILNYTNSISDTVSKIEPEEYYLLNANGREDLIMSASRVLQNEFIIIKGEHINPVNVNQKFYLLNNSWKLSQKKSLIIRDGDEHNFSLKYSEPFDIQTINIIPGVHVVKNIEWAHILIVRTTLDTAKNILVNIGSIEYIDLAERKPVEESPLRQYNPSINRITTAKNNYPFLHGNVMVSLKENSINKEDIDLLGKVTLDENSSNEFTQHAKEMGTLIGGRGNSFSTGEGVATDATIVCTNFSSLFAESPDYYNSYSILVQNHSYGTGIENYYGNESVSYDQITNEIPELVLVFSAGNAGTQAPESGNYKGIGGYANLTGDYKQSKNVLVIGAIDSTMNHVSLTSSGPAYDGRVKPELVTFGGEGTSESSAITTGSVAMLQDYYHSKNGSYPTSAMIKALLIAGANEAGSPGIDFKTGYGSINLNRSLQLIDSAFYQSGSVPSNSTHEFKLNVPTGTSQFKIVLTWIDSPANPEDARALVNDLDIKALTPSNAELLPWVLDSTPDASNLSAAATRGEDHLNNVEMISVDNPEAGNYTITIKAPQLATTDQTFSIAYSLKTKDYFEWSYPTHSDHLEATSSTYLRWENTYASQNGSVSIKYGNGDWVSVGTENVQSEQFKLTLPDTSVYAQVKMVIGPYAYVSDTFTVSQPLELEAENDCSSDFVLSWNGNTSINSYTLFGLENNVMSPLLNTSESSVKLDKATYPQSYFAVQPTLSGGLSGIRSYAIDYGNQNAGCYLRSFLALLEPGDYVSIDLSVNLPGDIEEVIIYKEFQEGLEIFQQFSPGTENLFDFQDYDLEPGRYVYTVQLNLKNGDVITSDSIEVFYTDKNTVMAFPNPVTYNTVNILNNYPGGTLQLINAKGEVINTFELVNTVENIDLTGFQKGMYLYRIMYEDKVVASGRIIRL